MTGKDHFIDDSNEYKFRSFELNFYGKKNLTSVAGFLFFFYPAKDGDREELI